MNKKRGERIAIESKIKLVLALAFLVLLILVWINKGSTYQNQNIKKDMRIVTALLPLQSITENLIQNTNIKIFNLVPKNIKINEYGRWFKEHNQDKEFIDLIKSADAVLGVSSIWEGDPLYPYSRMHNISITYIDAFEPFNPDISGIAKQKIPSSSSESKNNHRVGNNGKEEFSLYAWMSLSNAHKIAELIARDLQALNSEEANLIEKNLEEFSKKIFSLKTEYEEKFLDSSVFSISAFSTDFIYLTNDFNIPVESYFFKDAYYWTDEDYEFLAEIITDYDCKIFIAKHKLNKKIQTTIEKNAGKIIILDNFEISKPEKSIEMTNTKDLFFDIMKTNLEKLYQNMR